LLQAYLIVFNEKNFKMHDKIKWLMLNGIVEHYLADPIFGLCCKPLRKRSKAVNTQVPKIKQ